MPRRQKGGILLSNETVDADFMEFLSNSTLTYLTKGANGVVFVAKVKPGYVSKYKYMTPAEYGKPVTSLVVKFVMYTLPDELQNEVNVQRDIFFKTADYLKPLCPAIVYAGHVDTLDKVKSLKKLMEITTTRSPEIDNILRRLTLKYTPVNLVSIINLKNVSMDIVGMEFASNSQMMHTLYNTMKNSTKDDVAVDKVIEIQMKYKSYYHKGLFALLKLAMSTGLSQGDFHIGNILIDTDEVDYFEGSPGRAIIIDFGYALKIPDPILVAMRTDIIAGRYTSALKQLCVVGRNDGLKMTDFKSHYGWACGLTKYLNNQENTADFEADVDESLDDLFDAYDRSLTARISLFETNSKTDPDRYPKLPLSADVKKNIYAGFYPISIPPPIAPVFIKSPDAASVPFPNFTPSLSPVAQAPSPSLLLSAGKRKRQTRGGRKRGARSRKGGATRRRRHTIKKNKLKLISV